MKKIIVSIFLLLLLSVANAHATYTFIVPQKPGGGTTVWTELIVSELQKYLDENIVIKMTKVFVHIV